MSYIGETSNPNWGDHEQESVEQTAVITEVDYSDIDEENSQHGGSDDSDSGWEEVEEMFTDSNDSDDELSELHERIKKYPKIQFGDNTAFEGEQCMCKLINDPTTAISVMRTLVDTSPTFDTINCFIDNVIRSYNIIFCNNKKSVNSKKIAFCDFFYRLRHELMFKCLCLTLNLPLGHSDIPFKNFGIESDRTPDLILEEEGVLKVIEVTVVSSIEKAAQNKGMEEMGFESKYKKEIDMFRDKGMTVIYLPFFLDMSNPDKTINPEQIQSFKRHFPVWNEMYYSMTVEISKKLSILTQNMKDSLVLPSSILFSKVSPIKPKHESLAFLYKKDKIVSRKVHYRELTVSPYVYNKIINDRSRFFWMLDNNRFTDKNKVVFNINTVNHRVSLELSAEGCTINEMRQLLINNDVVGLLNYTKVKAGNVVLDSTNSETGVRFYERTKLPWSQSFSNVKDKIPLTNNHLEKAFTPEDYDRLKYKKILSQYKQDNYQSVHYDPNYEDLIVRSITEFDSSRNHEYDFEEMPNLLGNMRSANIDIFEVMADIKDVYTTKNSFNTDSLPIRKAKMKQPFLLPIANLNESSYCPLEYKNEVFINRVVKLIEHKNPFTSLLLKNVLSEKYNMYTKSKMSSSTLISLMKRRFEVSNEINSLQKSLSKDKREETKQLSKSQNPDYNLIFKKLRDEYKTISKEINNRRKTEGVGSNISYIRLPCKSSKGHLRQIYDSEMKHFKDRKKQSTIEGVGIINNIESDYESDLNVFQGICTMLCEDRGENPDKILDEYVSPDACLIKELKQAALDKYKKLIEQVRRSCLGHSSALISRMAHSLMFYSQLPFSSDYFRVDNLGYKNVLLMVRGGKKIFKSKSSKLFRLIFPISEDIIPWYRVGHKDTGSFTLININGEYYGLTPWSFLHESILTDSISFYSRVSSFTVLNLNPSVDLKEQFSKVAVNVLLSFHNRRQTEVILANMRYILLSTLGDFTGVEQILPEFFDFNYDRFQAFIRNSIMINYPRYFQQFQMLKDTRGGVGKEINISDFNESRLRNIFTLDVVSSIEDLALMIYSTFLMTKAPYQKVVERSRNLSGILEIHQLFDEKVGLTLGPQEQTEKISVTLNDSGFEDYAGRLFQNDFTFDPKFCALIGNFIDSIFLNHGETEDIEVSWLRIMNQPWDEMATSTGLRGDYEQVEDFWGQKGYFVVYKTLLGEPGFSDKLIKVFLSDIDDDTKRKIVRDMNELYKDKFMPDREFLIFHAVDKVQWRGGREIYVMDLLTKTMQQPIEKFMAVLCKKLDNELISIPSDRRAQVIHHSIFEKDLPLKDMMTWYLTLDCSKWAPKSVFIKFVVTLLNMTSIPNTFKTHFMNYIEKLYTKRIYFNIAEVNALKKNKKYESVCDKHLVFDKTVNGYYLEMPYSWVMGIFNYTSSFLHAANQKYISYLLMKTSLISFKEETSLVMFAHSDDSGGRLSVSSLSMAKRGLILYEIFLKSCNHLLSKKKSVVSRIYFEILSVIYLFGKLLALLPKFLGGMRFLPTDKGPAQDMLQSYSKSIEVMIAGADFSISYIVMKVYSYLVWRFYYHKEPSSIDYDRPVQYLGLPDAHPLFVLLCGSDSDLLRLMRNGSDLTKIVGFVNTMSAQMDGEGPIKPLKFEIKVKGIKRGFEDFLDCFGDVLKSWSIRNVNYHNTGLNTLSFLRKLSDSGFVGSLVNESTTRRISRCYFIRTGDSAITRFKNVKLSVLMDAICLCQSYGTNNPIRHVLGDILGAESVNQIEEEFETSRDGSWKTVGLLKETLKSPLRIYKYLDMMSLEGRKINETFRTLKPTQVQLVKSARVFSVDFDPASLVSYMKEPNMRWALPSVKGLFTAESEVRNFMSQINYEIEDVDPDMLLRVCRTYGRDNTKNIYLYSRVPGEVRQIKTYTAFLTFLSVNSFTNKEVTGLTLKMSDKEMGKEYIQPYLIEEVYTVNNIVSILLTLVEKCGVEFVSGLTLKSVNEIEWQGGQVGELIEHVAGLADLDVRYSLLNAQLNYLKIKLGSRNTSAEFLESSAYYTFLKSQKLREGWFGRGEVYIKIDTNFYSFIIENTEPTLVYTNKVGKLPMHHTEFIMDIFENINVNFKTVKKPKSKDYNNNHFGLDNSSEISILPGREIEFGIPCINITQRNDFVDQISSFEIFDCRGSTLIIKKGFEENFIFKKIQLLPIRKSEIIVTMKMILDAKSFEDKIIEHGVSDFEEFIYTEILTEYGKDLYIEFNELMDNFAASRLYSIFKECYKKEITKIPNAVDISPLPASEGSMVRILIDYSRVTKDNVMKVPVNLDPVIMQLRSEYPEKVATIIGEKLGEHHSQIYSTKEMKEITDNYDLICNEGDINKRRAGLVKLMTYWGYGSLVNNIKTFTLSRSPNNYSFFNTQNLSKGTKAFYAELFEFLIIELTDLIGKYRTLFNSLEYPIPHLYKISIPDNIVNCYIYHVVMSAYNYVSLNIRTSLYNMSFMNLLLACLKEEEFLAELQARWGKNYILGSLPIGFNHRYEIIATINVLRSIWCMVNKQKFKIDYSMKLQRFPNNVQSITGMSKKLGGVIKGAEVYYSGFATDQLLSYILSLGEVKTDNIEYRVNTRISKLSDVEVNMHQEVRHIRPIKPEVLDNPAWEDYNYELSMFDVDMDEVEALKEELGDNIYKDTVTKRLKIKGKNIITTTLHWILQPNFGSTEDILVYLRQVGENIALVTDTYTSLFLKKFPNSGCRIVNYSRAIKDSIKPFFIFYSLNKNLKKDVGFINKYFGGQEFALDRAEINILKDNYIRNPDGNLTDPTQQGCSDLLEVMVGEKVMVETDEGTVRIVKTEEQNNCVEENEGAELGMDFGKVENLGTKEYEEKMIKKMKKAEEVIDKAGADNILSQDSIKMLKNKYVAKSIKDGVPISVILRSIIEETELLKMNADVLSNNSGISSNDQKKMFLSPGYFGLGRSLNKTDLNPIKDKKLRSELNSLHSDLASSIGSNTLKLSRKFLKVVVANIKFWVLTAKNSKLKTDNKKFLITLIISICNNVILGDDESDDGVWQQILNRTSLYISDDGDGDDDDLFNLIFDIVPASRIKYRLEGT